MRFLDRLLAGQRHLPLLALLAVPLFVLLGSAELWTQEGRWGLICQQMLRSGDLLHPSMLGEPYYGKPLLSYWLILAAASLLGGLAETALRLPSALAGVLAVWCTLRIGGRLFDRATGRLAGAMLATSYMFAFWARVASADMLQVAGTIAIFAWYCEHREQHGWRAYLGFGAIAVVACMAKSPAAAVMALLAVAPDLLRAGRWRRHVNARLAIAGTAAAIVFFTPFVAARATATVGAEQASLWTLFRENVVRYFAPFDHGGPVWLYCVQLPVYLLPWSLWLPWFALRAWRERRALAPDARWLLTALALVFLFLTGCGSRRSYYILPALPFACLLLAHGMQVFASERHRRRQLAALAGIWLLLLAWFGVAVPLSSSGETTRRHFAGTVRAQCEQRAPWPEWRVLSIDAVPAASYYLQATDEPDVIETFDAERVRAELAAHPHTVVLSRNRHLDALRAMLPTATLLTQPPPAFGDSRENGKDLLIAFVP